MFTYKPESMGAVEYLRERVLDCDNESGTWKTLAASKVGGVVYAAVERLVKASGDRYVFAAVILTRSSKRDHDGHNFGWKDMDESMFPYRVDCPERILKLLSPTSDENSLGWRQACREKRRHLAERKKRLAVIMPGAVLKFDAPIYFSFGGNRVGIQVFKVCNIGRRIFSLPDRGGALVRLRRENLDKPFSVMAPCDKTERLAA
jgi:hypothetical protein